MPRYKVTALVEEDGDLSKTFDGPFGSLQDALKVVAKYEKERQGYKGFVDSVSIDRVDARHLNK